MEASGHFSSLRDSGMKPFVFFVLYLAFLMGAQGVDEEEVPVTCDSSVRIIGGTLTKSNGNAVGSVLNFECPDTHYPFPVSSAKCTKRGQWFRSSHRQITPICKEFQCPAPVLEEGMIRPTNTSYSIGDTVTFECYDGYELHGSVSRTCMKNGRWNGTITICNSGSQHCLNPGIPAGGRKSGTNYWIGDKVEYSCNNGLVLMGSQQRECLESKGWTGREPSCRHGSSFDSPDEVAADFTASFTSMLGMTQTGEGKKQASTARKIHLSKDTPLHIYILLDASESVGEKNFLDSKKVAENLINKIASFDVRPRFGIISYASEPMVIANLYDEMQSNAEDVIDLLQNSENANYMIHGDRRGTDIHSALTKVLEIMSLTKEMFRDTWADIRFVTILFTDGKANMGGDPKTAVVKIKNFVAAQGKSEAYLDMYAFGVTSDVDRRELNVLSSLKPGEYHSFVIRNTLELVKAFDKILDFTTIGDLCGVADETSDATVRQKQPWHAFMEIPGIGKCSGSILTPSWVLTAAHCLREVQTAHDISRITVDIGNNNNLFKVKDVLVHTEYDLAGKKSENITQFYDYDVALLELKTPISFSKTNSRSICLPCTRETTRALRKPYPETTCRDHEIEMLPTPGPVLANFVTRSGRVETLAHVTIKTSVVERKACVLNALHAEEYKNVTDVNHVVTDRFLCTGGQQPEADDISCKGDSGGSLFIEKKRRFIQVGVVSWGSINVCDDIRAQKQYARDFHINLFKVLPWLRKKLGNIITFID
ncbi:complement factor B-like isoform X1 [Scyliorhinus canicula]|uniref:complement factor B-like isoform X1 n=1 Tax=Scyliorhinus canicula TaxID=7830 RepID=UPI0018F63E73|nr:complement factor B-like isoform X1 [Scyliorhinus canicula]